MSEKMYPDEQGAPVSSTHNAPVSLADLVFIIWSRRLLIVAFMGIGLISAIIYLNVTTHKYSASMDLIPTEALSGGNLDNKLGTLSNLASSVGLGLPESHGDSKFELYLETIYSRSVADQLSGRVDLMKMVFANRWDWTTNRWKTTRGQTQFVVTGIKSLLGIPVAPLVAPSGAQLQEYIQNNVQVNRDPKKVVVQVEYDFQDPEFAKEFLRALNATVDNQLRQKALGIASVYIAYLSNRLKTVTIADEREAMMHTLMDQERSRMVAGSNAPFAAQMFGPPAASPRPTRPQAAVVISLSVILATFAGAIIALLQAAGIMPRPGGSTNAIGNGRRDKRQRALAWLLRDWTKLRRTSGHSR